MNYFVHPTAEVAEDASVGAGTRIWNQAQVRSGAQIGAGCVLGKNVFVDVGVSVGDRCKIENNASLFHGVCLEDGVFVGPHACLTNDRRPRATRADGGVKGPADWSVEATVVRRGASVGAGAILLPGITVGEFALVGAGAVVTGDVRAHAVVVGNPARQVASVCRCGEMITGASAGDVRCGGCTDVEWTNRA